MTGFMTLFVGCRAYYLPGEKLAVTMLVRTGDQLVLHLSERVFDLAILADDI